MAAGLWRMDVGPSLTPGGVMLEFSTDEESRERWYIDLAQSRSLVHLMRRLQQRAEGRR
ncbi:MAG TPA: hypothetical protein VF174_06020 [Micromonosporaceae bacterium]